jgi:hypothetical protein
MFRSRPSLSRLNFKILLGLGLTVGGAAFTLPACEITTDGDVGGFGGDDGSSGGKASGGKASGGKSSGGQGSGGKGTGGSLGGAASGGGSSGGSAGGGSEELDCQTNGTAQGEFKGIEEPDDCTSCLEEHCRSAWETCNAAEPSAACRWGSTAFVVGSATVEGEFDCMLACFKELGDDFIGDSYNVDECAIQCGSAECNQDTAGPVAIAVAECLGGTGDDDIGCQLECGL